MDGSGGVDRSVDDPLCGGLWEGFWGGEFWLCARAGLTMRQLIPAMPTMRVICMTCSFDVAGVLSSETCQNDNSLRSGSRCASRVPRFFSWSSPCEPKRTTGVFHVVMVSMIRSLNFAGPSRPDAIQHHVRVPMGNDRPVMVLPWLQAMTAFTKLLAWAMR